MVSGEQYLTADNTGIKWAALGTTIASSVLLALAGLWITLVERFIDFQVFLISGFGTFVERLVTEILGGGAGLIVASWRAAAVQAVEAGPAAPLLLAGELVVILLIAFAIWERRPYA